jgi:hypothetical protein
MSWWTNYLLLPSIAEGRDEIENGEINEDQVPVAIKHINAQLERQHGVWRFIPLDDLVWLCDTKIIGPHLMIPIIAAAPWNEKEGVQLLIRDESDYRWHMLGWDEIAATVTS